MADEEERALRRTWQATGAVADGAGYLRARLRSGLPRERLELAALLGEPAASAALADGPRAALARGARESPLGAEAGLAWLAARVEATAEPGASSEALRRLDGWLEGLAPGAALRAVLAGLRLVVERAGGGGAPLAAVDAAEAFVACPCSPHAAGLLAAETALEGARGHEDLARASGRQAVQAVVEGGLARRGDGATWSLCQLLGRDLDEARSHPVRREAYRAQVAAIAAALAPWALEADPLRARHPPLEGEALVPIDPPARDGSGWEVIELPVAWSEDPFGPVPDAGVEVRRGDVRWRGATHRLTEALRRLRFHVLARLDRPVHVWLDAEALELPCPPGATSEQLVAIEQALAAHEGWRRARWP